MDYQLLVPLLITSVVTLTGWLAVHRLNVERDQFARKKELRLRYLLDAYRSLAIGLHRRTSDVKYAIEFDQALADVQLLGSPKQIELLHDFLDSIEENKSGDLEPLLSELRSELRALVQMDKISHQLRWHVSSVQKKK